MGEFSLLLDFCDISQVFFGEHFSLGLFLRFERLELFFIVINESIGPDFFFCSWRYLESREEFLRSQYFIWESGHFWRVSKGVLKRNWNLLGNVEEIE